jgi:hypothetical protein
MITFQKFQAVEKLTNNDFIREDPGFPSGAIMPVRTDFSIDGLNSNKSCG